ncbi:hypothetical protein [Rhizobium sp. ICMP 5592]|uniref:hypothetical protein n=1 Tax=Rhizobium sp. ICMP 5592 TaxID=2292445 RepID=UPI001296F81D|nr:hypothetical protein [Rhizobium sp. ICMP 5592]MQB43029.1 hypothetical protein [Rhizobium sp. ICMP 5592]
MAVIRTKRNQFVYAYEAEPQDRWVKTLIGNHCLTVQHISEYQQAVDWAVSMADQFDPPLTILPFDVNDFVKLNRDRLERGLALLTPEEQHQLRQDVVTTCVEVMRDCDDPDVRADAYDVLQKMRVVQ